MPQPAFNPAYLADPGLFANQQDVDQRQAIAALLMQQGLAPMSGTESVGGVAIRKSPLEGAAKLAALLSGQSQQAQANEGAQQLMAREMTAIGSKFGVPPPGGQPDPRALGAALGAGPQGGQASGPWSLPNLSQQQNIDSYLTDPGKHFEAMRAGAAPTDLQKQLAGEGIFPGDPRYAAAMSDAVFKTNNVPLDEVKAGNTGVNRRTGERIYGVKLADGVEPTYGADGRVSGTPAVPGAMAAITNAKAAEQANDTIEIPRDKGTVQKMTKSQFLAMVGGGSTPYNFDVTPGTERAFRDAIVKTGDLGALAAFDAKYSGKMPGIETGQSTESKVGTEAGTKDVIARNQTILADANAAPLDIESLKRMVELTKTANFGPGASQVAKWKAVAAQIPGAGLITDPTTLEQQQTNVTLMKKYMSNMAGRMSGSSGTGTDARLQNAIDSLPNDAAPDAAIRLVGPMLIAQRTARIDEANLRSKFGNDANAIQKFETEWRNNYSPLAYEATLATRGMSPQQAAKFVADHYTPTQAAEIVESRKALRALGVRF